MSILNRLSSAIGASGNQNEIELAKEIAETENHDYIRDLIENLNNKSKKVQSECIKALYETGYIKPELIANYAAEFLVLLSSKNNRLVWGGMIALMTISHLAHKEIYENLELIKSTIEKGSVITIDAGVAILANLNVHSEYSDVVEPFLTNQLWNCPIKHLPQYMERCLICIRKENKSIYSEIIEKRLQECERESQAKRLNKVLKKMEKLD